MKKIVIIVALVCGAWQQADAQYVSKVWVSDQKDGTYINPIIHADYSDPDVCAVGDDFYMTASSFGCTPGLPIHLTNRNHTIECGATARPRMYQIHFSILNMEKGYGLLLSVTTTVSFLSIGEIPTGVFSW